MKYSFALMDETGKVQIYYAPSEHKAKILRRKKIKSSKTKIISVSNITKATSQLALPLMMNARIAFAHS